MTTPDNAFPAHAAPDAVNDILNFWFADSLQKGWPTTDMKDLWWGGSKEPDATVRDKFGGRVNQALGGGLKDWHAHPLSWPALVLLLDQFTRHVFRGSRQAFAGDGRTQQLGTDGLARGWDQQCSLVVRAFFTCRRCMPKIWNCMTSASAAPAPLKKKPT